MHKLTTKLVSDCKIIVMEDLSIKKMMVQKNYNARNMQDCAWGMFGELLNYKAENAGCLVIKVNPRNTTKTCSNCGVLQDMPLWKRIYECDCGLVIDRDHNAAINILKRGQGLSSVETNPSALQGLSMKQEAITSTQGVRL